MTGIEAISNAVPAFKPTEWRNARITLSWMIGLLTVAVPELVDRHWWHRIMHEHVAERLQPILQSLPRVVVTSVPFRLAD